MAITINGSGTIGGVTSLPTTGLQLADSNMPAGSVLQVVQATTDTATYAVNTSFFDTTLQGSITPSSSSNKILITVTLSGTGISGKSSAGDRVHYRLLRDSSDLHYWEKLYGYTDSVLTFSGSVSTVKLDSPSTTSTITYKVQMHGNGSEAVMAQWNSGVSTMTLMEIAA